MEGTDWLALIGIILGSLGLLWGILHQQSKSSTDAIRTGLGDRLGALQTSIESVRDSNATVLTSIHNEITAVRNELAGEVRGVAQQVESLRNELTSRIESLERETTTQVSSLKNEMTTRFEAQDERLVQHGQRLTGVEDRVGKIQDGLAAAASRS